MSTRHAMNDAIAKLLNIITNDPGRWDAYQQLARIMVKNEEFLAAEEYFSQAIKIKADELSLYLQLGELQLRTQQYKAAHGSYKQAIGLNPKHAQSYYMDAQALKNLGRTSEAILRLRTTFKLAPTHVQAFTECAELLLRQHQYTQAAEVLTEAIAAHPEHAMFYFRLGLIQQQLQTSEKALQSFSKAVEIHPEFAEAHHQRAILLNAAGKLEQALTSFDTAIRLQPHVPAAYNNRGVVLCQLRRYTLAILDFKQATKLNPTYASAFCNLGVAEFEDGELDAAYQHLEQALKYDPNHLQAQYTLSKLKLARGEFSDGWRLYESRWHVLPTSSPLTNSVQWRGEQDLLGKSILIYCEQTLSDSLQFCRYIPMLKTFKPNQIVVEVPEALFGFLSQHWSADAMIQVVSHGERLPHVDVSCPLLSLPFAFNTMLDTIPAQIPYLGLPDKYRRPWQTLLGPSGRRMRVGLNWCGDDHNRYDHLRSIPLFMLSVLLKMEVEWHSLQKEFRREDHIMLKRFPMLECHHPQLIDFTDTAGLIMEMDLVVSVDTAVAHMAAALGKEVWLMLPQHAHFRWLNDREDSPWYPNIRLFRMQPYQQWEDLADQVHQALSQRITEHIRLRSSHPLLDDNL